MDGIAYEHRTAEPEDSHRFLYPIINELVSDIPAGASVLDLGCGNGSFLSLFRGRSWRLAGTDFSPTGIETATKSFPEIDFLLADAESSTNAILDRFGPVDVLISTEVIEHLYAPKTFLNNAHDLLKPDGILIISTPYHGYLKNLALAASGVMDKHYTALWDHGHIKFWSKQTLGKALMEAGFRIEQFRGCGRLPLLWRSMAFRARKTNAHE